MAIVVAWRRGRYIASRTTKRKRALASVLGDKVDTSPPVFTRSDEAVVDIDRTLGPGEAYWAGARVAADRVRACSVSARIDDRVAFVDIRLALSAVKAGSAAADEPRRQATAAGTVQTRCRLAKVNDLIARGTRVSVDALARKGSIE